MADSFQPYEQAMRELAKRVPGSPLREAILTRLLQRVTARMNERFDATLHAHGLNQTTFTALGVLYASPGHSRKPSELSLFMISSRTNITRVADELENKGFIERHPDPEDRRQLDLKLTPVGRDCVRMVIPERRAQLVDLWAKFPESERKAFEALLRKLLSQLER